jgi:DNA polymerase elongation subunit (family B)
MIGNFAGWLIGIEVGNDECVLAFKTEAKDGREGRTIRIRDGYRPYFYALCRSEADMCRDSSDVEGEDYVSKAADVIAQHPNVIDARIEMRFARLDSPWMEPVIRVTVDSVSNFRLVAEDMKKVPQVRELAEVSVAHYFRYSTDKGAFIFRKYAVLYDDSKHFGLVSMAEIPANGTPQLRLAAMRRESSEWAVLTEDGIMAMLHRDEIAAFASRNEIDVLFSFGGDDSLKGAKGFVSNALGCFMKGCMHVDIRQDMSSDIYNEADFDSTESELERMLEMGRERMVRIVELSTVSGAMLDLVSRVSPGRLNTYLHMAAAMGQGHLIPDSKKVIESPKTLMDLEVADKGGLIFYPKPGVYRNVAKCDFASMYPNIIVKYNISSETMNCKCCATDGADKKTGGEENEFEGSGREEDGNRHERIEVPGTSWHICGKRKGVIPVGLRLVLERRLMIKREMRMEKDAAKKRELNLRQRALKNILVCAFGYLGFKNFIFSNVECKECVMLFGREILLGTKTIAESFELEVVYGITDSIFVAGGDAKTYREFADAVTKRMGIELEIDCTFTAIAFPCATDGSGIANKYYGIKEDDRIEARGIGIRHSDCPDMLKDFQEKAVRILLSSGTLHENIGKAAALCHVYKSMLRASEFTIESLSITKRIRRDVDAYVSNAPHVVACRQLVASNTSGYHRIPSPSSVTYVWALEGPRPVQGIMQNDVDVRKYGELLDAGFDELVRGLEGEGPNSRGKEE